MKKIRKHNLIIFISIMMDLSLFFLMDKYESKLYEIIFIWNLFWISQYALESHFKIPKRNISEKTTIALAGGTVLLVSFSALMGTYTYGQSFINGFLAQRLWLSCWLMYFPFRYWMKKGYVTTEGLVKVLKKVAIIFFVVAYLQYSIGDRFVFAHVSLTERYEESRFRFEADYLILLSGFLLDDVLGKKTYRKQNMFLLFAGIGVVALISKARMLTITLMCGLIFAFMLKRQSSRRKIYAFIAIIVFTIMFLYSPIGQDIIATLLGYEQTNEVDTLTVRTLASTYYVNLLISKFYTILFGYGYPSNSSQLALEINSPMVDIYRYYTSDVGIVDPLFHYGLIGIAWWLVMIVISIQKAFKIFKSSNQVAYIQLPFIVILGSITLVPIAFKPLILIPLYIAMLDYKYIACRKNE